MEKLVTAGSNDTPYFNFDPESGILALGGSSLPENVFDVFLPVVEWLDGYLQQPNPNTVVKFKFEYLNTASSHMIMQILEKFLKLDELCESFTIEWYYDKSDMDMRDFGEELSDLTRFPFDLIAVEDD
ncbi:MAG: DUF1987 domain-containing protein [Bacteroidales bacterium]|nr:DUF1987 domain-containing protein [Bacteroidales bacterium]